MKETKKFSCIILAGGKGRRVNGQDKGLINYKNKSLVKHVIDSLTPIVNEIIISANRNIKEYEQLGYRVVPDINDDFSGPLAGLAAALPYCSNDEVFIAPCDMPLLTTAVFQQLADSIKNKTLCIAEADEKLQPVFVMNKKLQLSIDQSLHNNQPRLMQWAKAQQPNIIHFQENSSFKNFNTADDFI